MQGRRLLLAMGLGLVFALACAGWTGRSPTGPPEKGVMLTFAVNLDAAMRERAVAHSRRMDTLYGEGSARVGPTTQDGRAVLVIPVAVVTAFMVGSRLAIGPWGSRAVPGRVGVDGSARLAFAGLGG